MLPPAWSSRLCGATAAACKRPHPQGAAVAQRCAPVGIRITVQPAMLPSSAAESSAAEEKGCYAKAEGVGHRPASFGCDDCLCATKPPVLLEPVQAYAMAIAQRAQLSYTALQWDPMLCRQSACFGLTHATSFIRGQNALSWRV